MEFEEGKRKFVNAWGTLGRSWGINKTMAQIHALLMISPEPLTTDDIMSCLLYTSPSPRDLSTSRMPSSA